ncbi:MAG: hypothetical protein KAR39_09635 [Thermoplasmata archaeon]|nr:hypothetical protein [Thermoplasmata archaeon]
MIRAERELKRFLGRIRKNLVGLSLKEKRSCLKEIEADIREHATSLPEDEETALLKSIESLGEPLEIANEYSVTVFEKPTRRTYALLFANMVVVFFIVLIGYVAAFHKISEDNYPWQAFPTDTLGLIVILLGLPTLLLLLAQIVRPTLIPALRVYILLPNLAMILFAGSIMLVSVWHYVPYTIFNPFQYLDDSYSRTMGLMLISGYAILFLSSMILLTWGHLDTKKYGLIVPARKVRKDDYVSAVMRRLASLDLATRKTIRCELQRDVDERLKDVESGEVDLLEELGSPNDAALMLLESHGPPPEARMKMRVAVPVAFFVGISLAIGLIVSIGVLQLATDPYGTFTFSALIISFPLLLISVTLWTFFSKMLSQPLKRRDYLKPTVTLAIVAILVLSLGVSDTLAGQGFSESTRGFHHELGGAYSHDGGGITVFWVREDIRHGLPYSKLHMTDFDANGEAETEIEILDLDRFGNSGHLNRVFMTSNGDYILVLRGYEETRIAKISTTGQVLEILQTAAVYPVLRFSEDMVYLAWPERENWDQSSSAILVFSVVEVEPNLKLINTWTSEFGAGTYFSYSSDRGRKDIMISSDRVETSIVSTSFGESYVSINLTFFSFDHDGNQISTVDLLSENITRQSKKDYGNYTSLTVTGISHIQNDTVLISISNETRIAGNSTRSSETVLLDLTTGGVNHTTLYSLTKYDPCSARYLRNLGGFGRYSPRADLVRLQDRLLVVIWELNIDRQHDDTYCYRPYKFNTTDSGIFVSVFDEEGRFLSSDKIASPEISDTGLFNLEVIEGEGDLTLLWGYMSGDEDCTPKHCEFTQHQTQLDKNGRVVGNLIHTDSDFGDFWTRLWFQPLKMDGDVIVGFGMGFDEMGVIMPEVQLDCRECYPFTPYLFLGELDMVEDDIRKYRISPQIEVKDEILQIILAIVVPALAIVTVQTAYLFWRGRRITGPKRSEDDKADSVKSSFLRQ